ncbi:transcriptional regulator [Nocardia sp. NPDC004722]
MRSVVLDSWRRSRGSGIDPDGCDPAVEIDLRELRDYRAAQPISVIRPVVGKLLVEDAADAGLVVAISDAAGRLLWVEGDPKVKARADRIGFTEGANWSEDRVGTNAPGTALALDHPVQIFAAEHFSRVVHEWSCSAAPVHDPGTGQIIGAIDITGGPSVAAPEALTLIRATVSAAEAELRLHLLDPAAAPAGALLRLEALGARRPVLIRDGERIPLSQRHAEILLLLAEHTEGLSADHLALLLDDADLDNATIRAAMSRLRSVVGSNVFGSRPYRLRVPIATDVEALRAALDSGDVDAAVRLYAGPVLPRSNAPGVIDIRDELRVRLRTAVLRSGDASVLSRWTSGAEGRDDAAAWAAYRATVDRESPLYAQIEAKIRVLDRRLGADATQMQRFDS